MNGKAKSAGMIVGMVVSWSLYYTFSKIAVDRTGSAFLAGFLLRAGALIFLTVQLTVDGTLKGLFRQGKAVLMIKAFAVTHAALRRKKRSVGLTLMLRKSTPSTSSTPPSMIKVPSQSLSDSFLRQIRTVARLTISTSVFKRAVPVLREPPA